MHELGTPIPNGPFKPSGINISFKNGSKIHMDVNPMRPLRLRTLKGVFFVNSDGQSGGPQKGCVQSAPGTPNN